MIEVYFNYYQAQRQLADIEAIDYFFAKEMLIAITQDADLSPLQNQALMHALLCLSVSLRAGHTCLPITEIAEQHWGVAFDEQGQCSHQGFTFPTLASLVDLFTMLNINGDAQQVIVFSEGALYMRRYYQFEIELTQFIEQRLVPDTSVNTHEIKTCLAHLFNDQKQGETQETAQVREQSDEIDWQKVAVANAINKSFVVIAGGPGTGKTYTVTKLLAALLMLSKTKQAKQTEQAKAPEKPLEIALVAPTGKAAQRLSESIIKAISGFKGLISEEVLTNIPTQAKTIHRLLGVIPNSPNFRHNQNNLLTCDVLLIDEVSMVDLPMMTRIFRALKPEAKIILLGDADQLPSVAVGRVLADIAPRPHLGYSAENSDYLTQVCSLDNQQLSNSFEPSNKHCDHLSLLNKSRRFDGEGGIGKIAAHVINGESKQSWQLLSAGNESDNSQLSRVEGPLSTWLTPLVKQYYQGIAKCSDITDAFNQLSKFRILCATRQGEMGVDAINHWVKEQLVYGNSQFSQQSNYHGMPIMISENDYRLGLFNGDIGILWLINGHLMAHFETVTQSLDEQLKYITFLPSRLPKYDSVYAMTIHKTQGSEFDHVAMLLPKSNHKRGNNLLSRELLYTGITRAKKQLTIASNEQTWQQSVKSDVKRYSGLKIHA